jgi:hypothetical protein
VTNPKTGKTATREEYSETTQIGGADLRGYGLDDDWEAVPGTWTLQVWYGDRMLAERSFTLVKP